MGIEVAIHESKTTTTLSSAILIYKGGSHNTGDASCFVSVHPIGYKDGKEDQPYIEPGVPASKDALSALVRAFIPNLATKKCVLPENVLSYDFDHLFWYNKPQKRHLWFKNEKFGGDVNATIDLPGLVFMVSQHGWFVYATDTKERPTADTVLYESPFLNVWKLGRICTGNIKVPKLTGPESMVEFEDAFFRSYFTHINIQEPNRLVKYPGGPYSMWKKLITGKIKKFPIKSLVSLDVTLNEALHSLTKEKA